ncbi:MAG: 1-phosphofructokinase family hexose kinase [Anaerolineaceae bacterium]|nr:1-phosphofructokinase family hexose kinase [Anaerolineaceae bacterium]
MIFTVTLNPAVDKTLFVDQIEFDGVLRANRVLMESGGKGFNVSRVLNVLGVENAALGLVGGAAGKFLTADLTRSGVAVDFTQIEAESRTNTVVMSADNHYVKVNELGPVVSEAEIRQFIANFNEKVSEGDHVVLCGSLPRGVEASLYRSLIKIIHERGAKAYLDASGPMLEIGIEAKPDVIKPNQYEAWEIIGETLALDATCEYFLDRGVGMVALSLGAEGLLIRTKTGRARVIPPRLDECYPVGAGDATLAGLLYAIREKMSLADCAKWAAASGTAAARSTSNSFASVDDVIQMLSRLEVRID